MSENKTDSRLTIRVQVVRKLADGTELTVMQLAGPIGTPLLWNAARRDSQLISIENGKIVALKRVIVDSKAIRRKKKK